MRPQTILRWQPEEEAEGRRGKGDSPSFPQVVTHWSLQLSRSLLEPARLSGALNRSLLPSSAGSRGGESGRQPQPSPGIGPGGCSRTGAGTGPPSPIALPPLKSSSAAHTVRRGGWVGGWWIDFIGKGIGSQPTPTPRIPPPSSPFSKYYTGLP